MSLRTFLFAADALRLEEGVGFQVESTPGVSVPAVPSPADQRARNAQAMAALGPALALAKNKGRR